MYNYSLENVKKEAIKFWNKNEILGSEIKDSDIKEVVRRAFRDLTVRTMNRLDKKTAINLDKLADGAKDLHKAIGNWLNTPKCDFDEWHKKSCDIIVNYLMGYYNKKDCTYGKAQKIVNMSLKNLYALCSARKIEAQYEEKFKACHLPLDSFTLEWLYRACKSKSTKINKSNLANWSAIKEYGDPKVNKMSTYIDNNNSFYNYISIQKRINELFDGENVTPLQAEFIIWPSIQFEMAAEGFYAQLCRNLPEDEQKKKKKEFTNENLNGKKKLIRSSLEELTSE